SKALEVSKITKDTPNPENGVIVRDPKTGELTGMLRNAQGVLKGVPSSGGAAPFQKRGGAGTKRVHPDKPLWLASVSDRNASRGDLELYYSLLNSKELTIRINVARSFNPYGTRQQIAKRFDDLPGKDHLGGPTGVGGIWIRIGPIKFFLDGGMLNGTAFMRQPWPKGDTYQIVEDDYRGLLFVEPEQLKMFVEAWARRKWAVQA